MNDVFVGRRKAILNKRMREKEGERRIEKKAQRMTVEMNLRKRKAILRENPLKFVYQNT